MLKWDGKLIPKEKYKWMNGSPSSHLIEYDRVNFVQYVPGFGPAETGMLVKDSQDHIFNVPLPKATKGEELAEYVARRSPLPLELLGELGGFAGLLFVLMTWLVTKGGKSRDGTLN